MGIPVIKDKQDFAMYVKGVESYRAFLPPKAFAIGAVRCDEEGCVVEAVFPQVNIGENFSSAAAFASVTHHRSGNAVRELGFWELKDLEQIFSPFINHHEIPPPNVAAFLEVQRLMCSPHNMKPVVVFFGDIDTSFINENLNPEDIQGGEHLRPIFEKFLEIAGIKLS